MIFHSSFKLGKENDVYEKLQAASKSNGHFKIYKLGEFPERWHCENIDRMGPIVAVADLHYGFDDVYLWLKKYQEQYNVTSNLIVDQTIQLY